MTRLPWCASLKWSQGHSVMCGGPGHPTKSGQELTPLVGFRGGPSITVIKIRALGSEKGAIKLQLFSLSRCMIYSESYSHFVLQFPKLQKKFFCKNLM